MPKKAPWPPHVKINNGHDRAWIPAQPGCTGYWYRLGPTGSEEARQAYKRLLAEEPAPTPPEPEKKPKKPKKGKKPPGES